MSSLCGYDGCVEKEDLKKALDRAYTSGFRLKDIARESGLSPDSLKQFRHAGSMGVANREKLEAWLKANGYADPNPVKGLRQALASELRSTAFVFEAEDVSDKLAFQRFKAVFELYLEAIIEAGVINSADELHKD